MKETSKRNFFHTKIICFHFFNKCF